MSKFVQYRMSINKISNKDKSNFNGTVSLNKCNFLF